MTKKALLMCLLLTGAVLGAGPGWRRTVAPQMSPQDMRKKISLIKAKCAPVSAKAFETEFTGAETITDEISTLARALQYDPKLIYEFVHNHIDYVPYYGSMKGATLTLISESGNDFDQASLMIALLRESGFNAHYVFGIMTIPNGDTPDGYNMANWLGIEPDTNLIMQAVFYGGIPVFVSETETEIIRVWVKLTIDGTEYLLDPAFKKYKNSASVNNILGMIGYNRNDFLNSAGGKYGQDYIKNINEEGLRKKLIKYTENFVSVIKDSYPRSGINEILGERKIVHEYVEELPVALRFPVRKWDEWENIPATTDFVHSVHLHYGEEKYGEIDKQFWVPEIAGKRIAIVYSNEYGEGIEQNILSLKNSFTSSVKKIEIKEPPAITFNNRHYVSEVPKLIISQDYDYETTFSNGNETAIFADSVIDFGVLHEYDSSQIEKVVTRVRNTSETDEKVIEFIWDQNDDDVFYEPQKAVLPPKTGYQNVKIIFYAQNKPPGVKNGTLKIRMKVGTNGWNSRFIYVKAKIAENSDYSLKLTHIQALLKRPATGTYYIVNNGSKKINILSMTKKGSDANHFSIISGDGGQIQPGEEKKITVEYKAQKHGVQDNAYIKVNYSYDGIIYNGNKFPAMKIPLYGKSYYDFYNSLSNIYAQTHGTRYLNRSIEKSCGFELYQEKADYAYILDVDITNIIIKGVDASHFEITNFYILRDTDKKGNVTESLTVNTIYLADTPGIHTDATLVVTCTYDEIPGHKVEFPLSGQTIKAKAQLWLDDSKIAEIDPPGDYPNALCKLTVINNHPYFTGFDDIGDIAQQTAHYITRGIGTYVLVSSFGGSGNGKLLRNRQKKLNEYTASGLSMSSREVFTESLNIMGQTWFQQTTLDMLLLGKLADVSYITHHRFGMAAQEEGFYIDVKSQYISTFQKKNSASSDRPFFWASNPLQSAMEHGVIEQLQYGKSAVSTVKLLQIANSKKTPVFWVNSNNFDRVRSYLDSYYEDNREETPYTSQEFEFFKELVEKRKATLVLPANSQIELDEWSGKGYIAFNDTSVAMIIGGNLFGGYNSEMGLFDICQVQQEYDPDSINIVERIDPLSEEPVNLTTGEYLYDHSDLSIGAREPRGLHFGRSYSSDNFTSKDTMGYGWTHNYDLYAMMHSDTESGLGKRTPIDAAPLIVASAITLDMMENNQLKEWVTSALIGNWAMDELLNNAVSIHLKNKVLKYIKLPDGSYNPAPGVTAKLIENNGIYRIEERHGSKIQFNSDKKIESWEDADGNKMSFTYNTSSNLEHVTDCYGRSFTFTYSNDTLTSIEDSTGRSISFGYKNDTLIRYNDPENNTWKYAYDTKNRMIQKTPDFLN